MVAYIQTCGLKMKAVTISALIYFLNTVTYNVGWFKTIDTRISANGE